VALFHAWYSDVEASREAAEAAMLKQAEEDALVGPSLPGQRVAAGGAAANYGGFLLPGEGDRRAAGALFWGPVGAGAGARRVRGGRASRRGAAAAQLPRGRRVAACAAAA
jgi:hypothetical protein